MTLVHDLDHRHDLPPDELTRLVGGKAANLNVMSTQLGLPVPPGFVIATAACRAYLGDGWPNGLDEEVRAHLRVVEQRVGRRFGDASDPLLVSVRSGAPVSMPGMMDTILNLGLSGSAVAGLAAVAGDAAFAEDCRRRFREQYAAIVGIDPPEDPWLQLRGAIEAVFRSWNGERARAYREREAIPDDLGTAVTVQAMVFGNRGADSGTGVAFTRNPATGEPMLYGDVLFDAQGEDVVAGTHRTEPLAVLDGRLPDVAREFRGHADRLERHYTDLCDIEFTIEQGRLWLLQVRVGKRSPRAALRIARDMAEDPSFPLTRAEAVGRVARILEHPPLVDIRTAGEAGPPITVGLPASPGAGCGGIETSPEAAIAAAASGRPVVLVRSETSPDDVPAMARAAAVLTARGGLASHAAVVARGWGIPAVVGARGLEVGEDGIVAGGRKLACGEIITIDGTSGEVFAGEVTGRREVAPEAAELLRWAAELGIAIGEGAATGQAAVEPSAAPPTRSPEPDAGSQPPASAGPDDLLRTMLVKGPATSEALSAALGEPADRVSAMLANLRSDGLVETGPAGPRLSATGRLRALETFAAETGRLGGEATCGGMLDEFLAFDRRMKDAVTAWQLRDVGGEQAFNDHSDSAYDAAVLDRLTVLHADTTAWLASRTAGLPRLDRYRARLARALDLARGGDQRYVASPRVDSYHGVWFELHEDLIRLAGRRRSEEAAASRA